MKAIILAAGKGKRLQSEQMQLPKHLREIDGKPILHYVLQSVDFIDKKDIVIVVGYLKEKIMNLFPDYTFAIQDENQPGYGTGYATKFAEEAIGEYDGDVFVLMGDMPLVTKQTLLSLSRYHKENNNDSTNLSYRIDKSLTFGRIIRSENGDYKGIVENKDCTDEQKNIREYNSGNAIFDSKKLFEQLANLKNNNKSGEYYLTDIPKLFIEKNYKVGIYASENKNEIYGVDTAEDLKVIEKILSERS